MIDRQFSIPAPWPEKPGEETRVMIDCFGGDEHFIAVRDEIIKFEWSGQFGPAPLNKDGSVKESIGPKHGFWRAASLWNLQGRRLEGRRAIWHEPRQPVYEKQHIRGRQYLITKVIDPGEPGHDW